MLAQALLMIEAAGGLEGLAHNSADYIHLVTEILKAACADREYRYGDPRFVDVGMDELLRTPMSPRASGDRPRARHARHAAAHRPLSRQHAAAGAAVAGEERRRVEPDTSYCCAVDRWGNAFGHAVRRLVALAGDPGPRHRAVGPRHAIAARSPPSLGRGAGQAARLTPNPAIAVRDDGSVMPFGAPGGDVQVQAMLQVFLNAFHFGMDIQEAIEQPRFATFSFPTPSRPTPTCPAG